MFFFCSRQVNRPIEVIYHLSAKNVVPPARVGQDIDPFDRGALAGMAGPPM